MKFDNYIKQLGQHQIITKLMLPKTTQLVVPEVARSWIINTYIKTVREKPLVIVTRSVEQAELLESNLIQVNKSIDIEAVSYTHLTLPTKA